MPVDPDTLRADLAELVRIAARMGEFRENALRCDTEGWHESARRALLQETDARHQVMLQTEEIVNRCTK